MSSRKEQKEQLRREREAREAAEREASRRKRLVGYAAGAAVVILALAAAGFLLTSGGDDDGGGGGDTAADVLPGGGEVPDQEITDLDEAAKAAGCELESFPGEEGNRDHITDPNEVPEYSSNPPSEGRHTDPPAEDGSYEEAPDVKQLVHNLEHGRVIVWFQKTLPANQRANLKALFDEDPYQMVLVPNETDMTYQVAATAWNRDPEPLGTGRLLGCDTYNDEVFDAIRAFKDEHRSNGPEAIP